MTDVNLTLVLTSAVLLGSGVYLLLERSLSRVLVGLVLMGNGVSIAFLVAGGPAGAPPIVGENDGEPMADPLPQAMVLTAIVITLATVAFVLAMAYRSWQLNGHDDVQDDVEDATIRSLASADVTSEAYAAVTDSHDADGSDDPRAGLSPDELGPPREPADSSDAGASGKGPS
jgi:multicomponent Na+:H+ antiporter subunit C